MLSQANLSFVNELFTRVLILSNVWERYNKIFALDLYLRMFQTCNLLAHTQKNKKSLQGQSNFPNRMSDKY